MTIRRLFTAFEAAMRRQIDPKLSPREQDAAGDQASRIADEIIATPARSPLELALKVRAFGLTIADEAFENHDFAAGFATHLATCWRAIRADADRLSGGAGALAL